MLILKRKPNEAITIGDDIEVEILEIDGDQVKLGIRAPKHIEIHRKEIYLAIQQENTEATHGVQEILTKLKFKNN